ncbi:putative cysteine desulfurase [Roseovarius sp. THAF9]|uniref:aminotransferase class V-fold PLP-dependent enzyme n=1 Tax=Roseovarius sp. THAF9 TaxID=2587847 RepID=UPI001268D7A3|nr:aminotransferase class V-fold PLP-dependent enzyme [Roseovarius sp. THAF9]QFT94866.1 putative cysteine desulfurase [Roseovarius sp. THAF9]
MTLDIARLRADTPACKTLLHFNNAGAGLMPLPVQEALLEYLSLESRIGGYEAAAEAKPAIDLFYTEMAALLNAKPSEIAFIENATRAWDMAFFSLPLQPGDRILTHASEYVSNYLGLLLQAQRRGLEIDLIPSDDTGQVDIDAIQSLIQPKTRLVALTHVPTQGGLVNPAEEVGRIAKDHGLFYLLDACQSAGQIDLDVGKLGCDMLSGTGRKYLRGPRGTGFLYVREGLIDSLDPPFIDLFSATWTGPDTFELQPDAKRFENWERFVAGQLGLGVAASYAREIGLPAIEARVADLGETLRDALRDIPGVTVRDLGKRKCGIVTFTHDGHTPQDMTSALRARNINISVSNRTSAQLDLGARGLDHLARASVHAYNTEDEIARFTAAVAAL